MIRPWHHTYLSAFPVNFGGQRPPLRSAPPLHGEHTDEILAGYQEVSVPS
ncbi:hypothetical protein GSM98_10515 [Rhodococcus rhodochrous]|nr:hypothetical protein [Rhodococcus rhodochrous]